MYLKIIIIAVMIAVTGGLLAYSEPPTPIANIAPTQTKISRQEARWIYTLKTRYWHDGTRITVYHMPMSSTIHQEFVRAVLEMQPSVYHKQVQANMNSGSGATVKEVKNHDEMVSTIQSKPGAVGYLSKDWLIINGLGHVDVLQIVD
jgi:ABC-type phosphate transport system substrate-binding protein